MIQGYVFYRPMPEAEYEELLYTLENRREDIPVQERLETCLC